MKKILFLSFTMLVTLFASNKEQLSVSILPQKYFVQKIVGDKFDVNVMVKPGFSPATYEPKASQMRDLVKSKIYFSIGVPFENVWLEKFKQNAKNTLFVDTTKGIKKIKMVAHTHHDEHEHEEHYDHDKKHEDHDEHEHHDHDKKHDDHDEHEHHDHDKKHDDHDEHEHHDHDKKHEDHDEHEEHHKHGHHEHGGLDPHVWTNPILVKTQAKNILEAVVKLDSKNAKFYEKNYKSFLSEIDELDKQIAKILKPYEDKYFMVFHPAWGYFAKRYDLRQMPIEVEGKEPKPNELVEMVEEAKEHNIKVVFVSPQFSQSGAKIISKNLNANVATINPLDLQWDKGLIHTAKEIAKSYK